MDTRARHVVPRYEGKYWAVIKGGGRRASGVYYSKNEAISRAITIVSNLGGNYVYVHDQTGRIKERYAVNELEGTHVFGAVTTTIGHALETLATDMEETLVDGAYVQRVRKISLALWELALIEQRFYALHKPLSKMARSIHNLEASWNEVDEELNA